MKNCKDTVKVTMKASVLDVTPEESKQEKAVQAAPLASGLDPELVAAGEKVFAFCKACHQVGEGAKNGIGPHLNDVFNRKLGGLEGFKYSKVFQAASGVGMAWSDETMSGFLKSPLTYMPGTNMGFGGVQKEEDLNALIEYLKSL